MRNTLLRGGILICLAMVAVQAVWLWASTGHAVLTRYHDPLREKNEAGGGLAALFEGTGLEDETGPLETVPNRFTLGMLPSGTDKHIISVLTLSAPLLFAVGLLGCDWYVQRRRPRQELPLSAG
jgi:hypothetical protein